jgi:hypothetical protein
LLAGKLATIWVAVALFTGNVTVPRVTVGLAPKFLPVIVSVFCP